MPNVKFSILICSIPSRESLLKRLLICLERQMKPGVEILIERDDKKMSIGKKRNLLLEKAKGDYIAFVDDDDMVSETYIREILKAIKSEPDVVGIEGRITVNGLNPKRFIHSLQYRFWFEKRGTYYRNPNHLNPVKRELALKAGFPDKSHGEDRVYSERLLPFLKKEVYISKMLYKYLFVRNK